MNSIPIFSSELANSFIDSGVDLVLSICFVLAVVLNSENKFIFAKLTVWVWCGVAIMNGHGLALPDRFFPFLYGGKKGLVWFTVASRLSHPPLWWRENALI